MPETGSIVHFSTSPFFGKAASETEYERVAVFIDAIRRERLPDDPPASLEELLQKWKNFPDFIEEEALIVWNEEKTNVAGFFQAWVEHSGDNEHICEFEIMVLPQFRCRGIARQLLSYVVDFARRHDRRLLKSTTYGTIPAGDAFMRRLGAQRGLENHINQLKISELSAGWVEKWIRAGETLSSRFELGLWEGPVPEEHLAAVAELIEMVLRDAPHDQLEEEPRTMTPEILRQIEKFRSAAGLYWWTMYVLDRSNRRYSGWTEVVWNTRKPMIVEQSGTGVYPDYRGLGLGRWLKAAMIQKLLRDHPEMKVIRTCNADSNAAVVKINQEMGYKPYTTLTYWQVERDQLERYLAGN